MATSAKTWGGRSPLAITHPEIAAQFVSCSEPDCVRHDIQTLTAGSQQRVMWSCGAGHRYVAQVRSRTDIKKPTACRECSGASRPGSHMTPLLVTHPELALQAVECREIGCGTCSLEALTAGSHHKWAWACEVGHIEVAPIYNRTRPQPWTCPGCVHSSVSESRLSAEFVNCACNTCVADPIPAHSVENLTTGSGRTAVWQCATCDDQWTARVSDRLHPSHPTGCSSCAPVNSSRREREVMEALALELGVTYTGNSVVKGWSYPVDFFVPEAGLVVQYDSRHYHSERVAADKRCIKALRKAGWNIVRIREAGLPRVTNNQLTVGTREAAATVAAKTAAYLRKIEMIRPA